MSQADRIRSLVIREFVEPARSAGRSSLSVRAGDVHRMMGLSNMPRAVCSVLRGTKLHSDANLIFRGQDGPADGMNVWFHFNLTEGGSACAKDGAAPVPTRPVHAQRDSDDKIDLRGSLVLISCTKAKLNTPAPARKLYCSAAFQMKRQMAERDGAAWLVLSARHGIIRPNDVVEPYDETLTEMGVAARKAWARSTLPALLSEAKEFGHVVCLAGQRYIEFLVQPLADIGIKVSEPLRGLRQGEQLSWLTKHQ